MRKNRDIEQDRCYHLISRLAHRAFFLDDEEKDRAVALMRRVEAGVKASMSYCINRTVSISPFDPSPSQLDGRNIGHSLLKAVVTAAFFLSVSAVVWAQSAPRLAFQVYAVRDMCEKDFVGTLKAAKAMGYEGVETGRFYGLDAKGLKAACDEAGLELVALQLYPHNLTEPQLAETIKFCKDCGCKRINTAWFKGSAENPNDWQLLVNVLNHAAEVCAKDGIYVAYHNHDHEFRIKFDGKCVWDWLYAKDGSDGLRQVTATPRFSDFVLQELDCGNCVLGGGDPIACLAAHPHRNPTVHIMPAIADSKRLKPGEAGVGSSCDKANWRRIIPALAADGAEWLVVKPTTHPGSLDDLEASIKYLKGILR